MDRYHRIAMQLRLRWMTTTTTTATKHYHQQQHQYPKSIFNVLSYTTTTTSLLWIYFYYYYYYYYQPIGFDPTLPSLHLNLITSQYTIDQTTNLKFASKIHIQSNDSPPQEFKLLGCGTRQVTFLNINVYSVAIYIPTSTSLDSLLKPQPILIYIIPARTSTSTHLRDGFIRAFMQFHGDNKPLDFSSDIQSFKSTFPSVQKIQKDTDHLALLVHPDFGLHIFLKGQHFGHVPAPWLGSALLHAYLRVENPISPSLVKSVQSNLQ